MFELLLIAAVILGFGILGYLVRRWITDMRHEPDSLMSDLLKSFDTRSQEQTREIRSQTKSLNERLDNAASIIAQVQKNIGEFSEIGRSMRDLQEFLKSPKLRGNIGEEVLADLIGQMFPKGSFFLQYGFKSGARVDAVIKTDGGLMTIDAKFPLENYQKLVKGETEAERESARREFIRDVKEHISTISDKYILPEEGTFDFALMYVPSEPVFYELVQMTEVTDFARKHRVYPVSPTTLYAHLQTILLSYAGKQMETKSREVFKLLRAMIGDYEKVEGSLNVLQRHMTNAYNQMSQVSQSFLTLGRKLKSTQKIETVKEPKTLGV